MISVSSRYAARSLRRSLRRTALSVVGVGLGTAIGLITISWIRGEDRMIASAAAESGAGHVRLAPAGWTESRDRHLRLSDWEAELAHVRAHPEVAVATPRVRVQGLLGMGTRVTAAEVVGVDPSTEPATLRFVRRMAEGRYLRPGEDGVVVVGRTVLERLDAALDDELVVTVMSADGELGSALLRVVGVVETGSREIDAAVCQVSLADARRLAGRDGTGEIVLMLKDHRRLEPVAAALAVDRGDGNVVLRWYEVNPELSAGRDLDAMFGDMTVGIVLMLVLLGVASAQLTGVLQRRKEFAVLAALGMKSEQLLRVMVLEALLLGVLGCVVAFAIAVPAVYHLATEGVDLAAMMEGGDLAMGGILIDSVFRADFGLWMVPTALALAFGATLGASIYPAWFASRTDPAAALRAAE